jgi:hypothetical protein
MKAWIGIFEAQGHSGGHGKVKIPILRMICG